MKPSTSCLLSKTEWIKKT